MRAAEWRAPEEIALVERPVPVAAHGQAVVAVASCGICGSDLHSYRHGLTVLPGHVLGHEFSGTIVEAPGVDGLRSGDRVTVRPLMPCGDCPGCRAGKPQQCLNGHERNIGYASPGAFAEQVLVPRAVAGETVFALPAAVSDEAGALVEPLAVALHAVRRSGARPGDSVLVLGAGPIGLGVTILLALEGVTEVVVADPSGLRRARALEHGAMAVIDPVAEDITLAMRAITGPGVGGRGARVDRVIDCAGSEDALAHALKAIRQGGVLVLTAVFGRRVALHLDRFVDKELDVRGSFAYADEFPAVIELLASGAVDVRRFVTHVFGLDRIQDAFRAQLDAEQAVKVLVSPSGAL